MRKESGKLFAPRLVVQKLRCSPRRARNDRAGVRDTISCKPRSAPKVDDPSRNSLASSKTTPQRSLVCGGVSNNRHSDGYGHKKRMQLIADAGGGWYFSESLDLS